MFQQRVVDDLVKQGFGHAQFSHAQFSQARGQAQAGGHVVHRLRYIGIFF
jgi:hypothetical protein